MPVEDTMKSGKTEVSVVSEPEAFMSGPHGHETANTANGTRKERV